MISLVFKGPLPGRIDYGDTELAVENCVFGGVSFPTKKWIFHLLLGEKQDGKV